MIPSSAVSRGGCEYDPAGHYGGRVTRVVPTRLSRRDAPGLPLRSTQLPTGTGRWESSGLLCLTAYRSLAVYEGCQLVGYQISAVEVKGLVLDILSCGAIMWLCTIRA